MKRRILRMEGIEEFVEGVPITNRNRYYVERAESLGMMQTYPCGGEEGKHTEYARFTPRGFRREKRRWFFNQKGFIAGFKREVYDFLSTDGINLGEMLFIGDLK